MRVTREGKRWVGSVEGLVGAATETTRLTELDVEVLDLITGLTDADEVDVTVRWDLVGALSSDEQTESAAFVAGRPVSPR